MVAAQIHGPGTYVLTEVPKSGVPILILGLGHIYYHEEGLRMLHCSGQNCLL